MGYFGFVLGWLLLCVSCNFTCFGDAGSLKGDSNPRESLISCARQCGNGCSMILYGPFGTKGANDCLKVPNATEAIKLFETFPSSIFFEKETAVNSDIVPCSTYVDLTETSRTIRLPSDKNSCDVLIGVSDVKSLLKIETIIHSCPNCSDNDTVTIYNVRDNVKDAVSTLDQSQGTVVCQKAARTAMTTVFVAANESYVLIHMTRSLSANMEVEFRLSKENWDTPYDCKGCTQVFDTLPNQCHSSQHSEIQSFVNIHTSLGAKSALPTVATAGNISPTVVRATVTITSQAVTRRNKNAPTFSVQGSLIRCARQCSNSAGCSVLIYGKVGEPNYDCGYGKGTASVKQIQGSHINIAVFGMDRQPGEEKVPCQSYVDIHTKSRKLTLPTNQMSCDVLVGTRDAKSLLKIETSIQPCPDCTEEDVVTIYNVRDKVKDTIMPLDQLEGTAVCLKTSHKSMTSVFLAANESYVLIHAKRSSLTSKMAVEFVLSKENWDTPYHCPACTNMDTPIPNQCRRQDHSNVEQFLKFHSPQTPTSPTAPATVPTISSAGSHHDAVVPTNADASSTNTNALKSSNQTANEDMKPPRLLPDSTGQSRPSSSNTTGDNSTTSSSYNFKLPDFNGKDKTEQTTPVTSSSLKPKKTPRPRTKQDDKNSNNNNDKNDNNNNNNDNNNNSNNNNNANQGGNQQAQASSGGGSGGASSATIGGAVGGVLGGVAVAGLVGGLLYRRHKRNKVVPSSEDVEINLDEHFGESSTPCRHDSHGLVVHQGGSNPPSPPTTEPQPPYSSPTVPSTNNTTTAPSTPPPGATTTATNTTTVPKS